MCLCFLCIFIFEFRSPIIITSLFRWCLFVSVVPGIGFQLYQYIGAFSCCPSVAAGGRRSPAVACWASDHWVASSNPLRGKFRH